MIQFIKHNDPAFRHPLDEHHDRVLCWLVKVNIQVEHRDNKLGICLYKCWYGDGNVTRNEFNFGDVTKKTVLVKNLNGALDVSV